MSKYRLQNPNEDPEFPEFDGRFWGENETDVRHRHRIQSVYDRSKKKCKLFKNAPGDKTTNRSTTSHTKARSRTPGSVPKIDDIITDRIKERGFELAPTHSFEEGRLISAVIHEQVSKEEPLWKQMQLDESAWAVKNKEKLTKILDERKELFDYHKIKKPFALADGKPYRISIDLLDDNPIVQRAWRLGPKQQGVLDDHLNELLASGVIYPIDDSNYSAVTVLVKKPGRPGELRVTTDYRRLNAKSKKFAFMSPTATECFDMTAGADTFSCIDVHSAFYCMEVELKDQPKLAFSTHRGMFTYRRMPQGFINSPSALGAAFHRMLMTPYTGRGPPGIVGKPCLGNICCQFVDDILVFSNDEYHADYLDFIFTLMEKHNLSLRPDKCFLGQKSVKYLGVILSGTGLRVDPGKVEALHKADRPVDPAGIRRFLGAAGFMRSFIPNFSQNTAQMTGLLSKGVPWVWDDRHNKEYDYILKKLASDTCLAVFDHSKPVILRTDASAVGWGAVLTQVHNKIKRPVHYASHRCSDTEAKRPARDLELGALTWAVLKFRPYLLHRPFVVEGDHSPLQYLSKYQGSNRRIYNYSLILSDYDWTFKYKKGETMCDADWLSRHPGEKCPNDFHPDRDIDPECGTDLIRNHVGVGTNLMYNNAPPVQVAAVDKSSQPLKAPKLHPKPPKRTDEQRAFDAIFRGNPDKPGNISDWHSPTWTPTKHHSDDGVFCGQSCLCCRAQNNETFGACPICTYAKRKLKTTEELNASYLPPFWGRDVPCTCATTCQPAESNTIHGRHGYGCKKVYESVLRSKPPGQWKDPVKSMHAEVPKASAQPGWLGQYNVISIGDGIGLDDMALSNSSDFAMQYVVESNELAAQLAHQRTGTPTFKTPATLLAAVKESKLPMGKVDVLSWTLKIGGDQTDELYSAMFGTKPVRMDRPQNLSQQQLREKFLLHLDSVVKAISPRTVLFQLIPPTDPKKVWKNMGSFYYQVEQKLHDMGFEVDAKIVNSAEVGGLISHSTYHAVAHKATKAFPWPTELETFGGIGHMLETNVDRRLFRESFTPYPKSLENCEFQPKMLGFTQGGDVRLGHQVFDTKSPIRPLNNYYNKLTRANGGGCIQTEEGIRSMTQTELMDIMGFSKPARDQLTNRTATEIQQLVSTTPCVTTRTAMFSGILEILSKMDRQEQVVKPQWGTTPCQDGPCNTKEMPHSTNVAGAIASGRCNHSINGVLQHVTMPSFREVRDLQKRDPHLKLLYNYVKTSLSEQPDPAIRALKHSAEVELLKEGLHIDHRRHADYFHIADGALMFRDILNDEWLTNAVVVPPILENQSISAFHDSGYGCHLGAHKTRVALQERVWFPKMAKKVKAYCDLCGACKVSKLIKRAHSGDIKSSMYSEAFEHWACDLQGPFLKSEAGNKYHCHMVDLTTNWNISIPLPDKKAATVATAIHRHLIIGGPCTTPTTILTDQGSEYMADITQELFKQFKIRHLKCTVAHPTGNAVCERQHRTYNHILRTFLHKYGKDWDEALPYACYAINTHAIEGCNISPYEMVYGRKPNDPNCCAVQSKNLWGQHAEAKFISNEEFTKLKRARMDQVMGEVNMQRMQSIRQHNTLMRKAHYHKAFAIGDLVNRWTANPKIGAFGKLAYKCTGPYEITGIHPRNPDVYRLVPLGQQTKDPTSHHVRELVPYITKDAHEKQMYQEEEMDNSQVLADVSVGDFLLLPYGPRDYVVEVKQVESAYLRVQYYNTATPKKNPLSKLYPTWFRQNPKSTEEDLQEVYATKLTPTQISNGYHAYDETMHMHQFYQAKLDVKKDLRLDPKDGSYSINKLRLAAIKRHKPLVPL